MFVVMQMPMQRRVQTHSLHLSLHHYWYNAKLDANTDQNTDVGAECERAFWKIHETRSISKLLLFVARKQI